MRKKIFLLLLLFTSIGQAHSEFKFRVWLKDKSGTTYSFNHPDKFLSDLAIARRNKQHIPLDSTDIPVSKIYLSKLNQLGVKIITTSRWMNSVVISMQDSSVMTSVRKLPFVVNTQWVWQGITSEKKASLRNETFEDHSNSPSLFEEYGYGLPQLAISNGNKLHAAGFRGEGKIIAVIDAGFYHANTITAYNHAKILGSKDFVQSGQSIFEADKHGQMVLSVMAAIDSFRFIGSAPKASYWLLRSEDSSSEYPVEEDYWAAAAEFADSVGVDIINTSLGYSFFDNPTMSHTHSQLDGKTIFVSQAAQMATNKGIFVVVSAGNEGNKTWGKINAPADAKDVLTVGAINVNLQIAAFSSLGFTADNRIKPDVVAVGEGAYLIDGSGALNTSNGTSFSAPLMSGMVACLWQALPNLTNKQLLELIRSKSSFYDQPDVRYGFGVPDMIAAYSSLNNSIAKNEERSPDVYFNSRKGNALVIKNLPVKDSLYTLRLFNETGKMVYAEKINATEENSCNARSLKKGVYIVYIEGENFRYSKKITK